MEGNEDEKINFFTLFLLIDCAHEYFQSGTAVIFDRTSIRGFIMEKPVGFWIIIGLIGAIIYIFSFIGTLTMAAEKNRRPFLWLPFAIFLAPFTFLITLFMGYTPRKFKSSGS